MIKRRRHAEAAVYARIVLDRNAGDAARLHEREQLIATGVEENMPNRATFLNLDGISNYGFEAQNPFVKRGSLIQVQR